MEKKHGKEKVYWGSPVPGYCDTCDNEIHEKFFDAKTIFGGWSHMCINCFHLGPGQDLLGPGLGQEYTKQADGKFLKTGG